MYGKALRGPRTLGRSTSAGLLDLITSSGGRVCVVYEHERAAGEYKYMLVRGDDDLKEFHPHNDQYVIVGFFNPKFVEIVPLMQDDEVEDLDAPVEQEEPPPPASSTDWVRVLRGLAIIAATILGAIVALVGGIVGGLNKGSRTTHRRTF